MTQLSNICFLLYVKLFLLYINILCIFYHSMYIYGNKILKTTELMWFLKYEDKKPMNDIIMLLNFLSVNVAGYIFYVTYKWDQGAAFISRYSAKILKQHYETTKNLISRNELVRTSLSYRNILSQNSISFTITIIKASYFHLKASLLLSS